MSRSGRYAEFVRGALSNRGTVLPVEEIKVNPGERECYRSMFVHGPALAEWVKSTGSVKGYVGPHAAEAFVIDVDSETDLEIARVDAVKICRMLEEIYDVPIAYQRIAFSGAKGFHVSVPMRAISADHLRPNFADIFKGMAADMFDGFTTVDLAIYENKRILRMPNTVNAKTGLHKIPISFDELCTDMDAIRGLARAPRNRGDIDLMPLSEISLCEGISGLFEQHAENVRNAHTASARTDTHAHADDEHPDNEIMDLFRNGTKKGHRDTNLTKLAGFLIKKGIDRAMATEMLLGWNKLNDPPFDAEDVINSVADKYARYGASTAVNGAPEILTMKEAGERYVRYIHRMREARVRTGFAPIDQKLRAIAPGEVLAILGRTSVGKSALLQNIGRNYAGDSGAPVIMFSLEMPDTSVYERSIQLEYGMTGYEVERMFDNADDAAAARHIDAVYAAMSNFYIVVRSMDIPTIDEYVQYAEANIYKQKTGLILIDYLGLVKGKGKDVYQEISKIARDMKELAKSLGVPICYLSQVNRNYRIDQELDLAAARDSGAIEEAADYILGIWRAEENLQQISTKMRCNIGILKNRKGGLSQYTAWMDKKSLVFDVEADVVDQPTQQHF